VERGRGRQLFLGTHEHSLDDKGRIILPSRFRPKLEEGAVLVLWLEECVTVFPRSEFDRIAEKIKALPEGNKARRLLAHVIFGNAYEAVPDRQGRLTIPPRLRQLAGLNREVVAVGLADRVEIWDRERWEKSIKGGIETREEAAEKLAELGF